MSYLDVIPLSEAKVYLRVDDTLTEDDARITSMIKAVLSNLERKTNILFYARDKNYLFQNYSLSVYDYPINSIVSTFDVEVQEKTLYTNYCSKGHEDTLVLNVGYTDVEDIPSDLIEVAYEMLDIMYYAKENKLSELSKMVIANNKRFII